MEERELQALMQWEGEDSIYSIGSNRMLFLGNMEGILYVENEKGDIDGAFTECPISQELNLETGEAITTGQERFGNTWVYEIGGTRYILTFKDSGELSRIKQALTLQKE